MSGIDALLIQYGLVAIFLIMFIKTIGVPIPIPGDLIILAAAARVAQGKLVGWQVFCALLIALVLGGTLQFLLSRGRSTSSPLWQCDSHFQLDNFLSKEVIREIWPLFLPRFFFSYDLCYDGSHHSRPEDNL